MIGHLHNHIELNGASIIAIFCCFSFAKHENFLILFCSTK
ncbi:hypothetical protein HMPREF9997_01873 [Corynebacterium durum F0235]|uniref:Uncharacterized protein n=1 Tax=Corynebacterium durum F0235 TaxID=1035195 RepID=L1MDV7_9CORY|nr:hypothetical protein HMPREF9997_01873 [Corynebacterium durum F0235]